MHHKETRAEGELNVAQHVLMWLSLSYAWGVSYVQNPGGRGVLVSTLHSFSWASSCQPLLCFSPSEGIERRLIGVLVQAVVHGVVVLAAAKHDH